MGIDANSLRFLFSAEKLGLHGSRVCTLGRLASFISDRQLHSILNDYGKPSFTLPSGKAMYFAEDVLKALGYTVDSLDASAYEGASIIHDLNLPIDRSMDEKYDLVWDGGTLEHVFNFPIAISNAMRMVAIGGHLFLALPANNQCGHGFYQFSPELFFRLFTRENGFELIRIFMESDGRCYHVVDPITVHGRVQLLSSKSAILLVHARKIARFPSTLHVPQQSDYEATWDKNNSQHNDKKYKSLLRSKLTPATVTKISNILNRLRLKRAVWNWKRNSRLSNRRFYVPVQRWDTTTMQATDRHKSFRGPASEVS